MKKLIPILLVMVLLCGCSSQSEKFDAMLEESFVSALSDNGLNTHYSLKDPAAFGVRPAKSLGRIDFDRLNGRKSYEASMRELKKYDYSALTPSQQLTYDVLLANLSVMEKGLDFGYYDELFYPRTGAQSQLPILLAEYRIENEDDVKSYLTLVADVKNYFNDLCVYEKQHAAMGFFMPVQMVDETVAVCKAFIENPDENVLIASFKERIDAIEISEKKREGYLKKNEKLVKGTVIPAYESLINWLLERREMGVNDIGLWNILNGDRYYEYLVAASSGSDKSVAQIAKLLDNYIEKSTAELLDILRENPTYGSADSFNYAAATPEDCIKQLKIGLTADFPPIPDASEVIKYLPKSLQDTASSAFYLIPPIDAPQDNIIYINEAQNGPELFPLLAHEGYPGHLYQTVYFNTISNVPLRKVMNFPAYSEGWATYVEQASYAWAGNNSDSLVRFKNLAKTKSMAMMARMEIGIHYNGWDRGEFAQYYAGFGVTDPISNASMYDYCLTDPVGHIPYIVGYLELMEIRDAVAAKQGAAFNLKDFHKSVLDIGPAPFSVIRKQLGV